MAAKTQKPAADHAAQDDQITLGGEVYTLRYGWGAFTAVADALGCTVVNVESRLANMPISALNTVVWAGLLKNHPGIAPETVDALLDADDMDLAAAQAVIQKAGALFRRSMPKQETEVEAAQPGPQTEA